MSDVGENARLIRDAFRHYGVDYMFIGAGATVLQGSHDTTQDVDVMPLKSPENGDRIIHALESLDFVLDIQKKDEILRGKDFVQFVEPFEFDLVFGPDGFNSYQEALKFKVDVDGYPCMSLKGIIRSKKAAGRPKDLAKIPMLEALDQFRSAFGVGE